MGKQQLNTQRWSTRRPARRALGVCALVLLWLLLAACRSGNEAATTSANMTEMPDASSDSSPVNASVRLVCDLSCAERGQCGTAASGQVVLLNRDAPAVSDHNVAVPVDTVGTVTELRGVEVRENVSGQQFTVTFFKVFIPERSSEAWVPQWCVTSAGS